MKKQIVKIVEEPVNSVNLLERTLKILEREVTLLEKLSKKGKLEKKEATDLATYINLLKEVKAREDLTLSLMSDEQLSRTLSEVKSHGNI